MRRVREAERGGGGWGEEGEEGVSHCSFQIRCKAEWATGLLVVAALMEM